MKSILTFALVTCLAWTAEAQMSSKDGLDKIKGNLENSKSNLSEYQKNMKIVDSNIVEVGKARSNVEQQKTEVTKSLQETSGSLQGLEKQEAELQGLIKEEQTQLTSEQEKIAELEKMTQQLKENQKKRQANIVAYSNQLKQVSHDRNEWKARTDKLAKTKGELDSRSQSLGQQETDWKNKKRGYEGEVSRWKSEVDRNQKLKDNYSSLAEVKE